MDQVLLIRTGEFPHLVLQMRSGRGMLYLGSRCWDRDHKWILISPANETGKGPYLVPGFSKSQGVGHSNETKNGNLTAVVL